MRIRVLLSGVDMPAPNASEIAALSKCGELLKFAAENKTGLPSSVISDIESAWLAQTQSTWEVTAGTKFWTAYDALCSFLRPVTLDTLAAATTFVQQPRWIFFGRLIERSLPRRWAHRFLGLAVILLLLSMTLAFVVATGEKLTGEITVLIGDGNKKF